MNKLIRFAILDLPALANGCFTVIDLWVWLNCPIKDASGFILGQGIALLSGSIILLIIARQVERLTHGRQPTHSPR